MFSVCWIGQLLTRQTVALVKLIDVRSIEVVLTHATRANPLADVQT